MISYRDNKCGDPATESVTRSPHEKFPGYLAGEASWVQLTSSNACFIRSASPP